MPSLQQPPNFKDCPNPLPSDILQKHSINSLLEHNDLILHRNGPASPSEADQQLTFAELFGNMATNNIATSTSSKAIGQNGFSSHNNGSYVQTTQPKPFENFQFDSRSLQRNLSYDCNVTTPTTPSTPGSSKAFNQISTQYGSNDSGNGRTFENGYFRDLSRTNSPTNLNDIQDIGAQTLENHSLAEIMNLLHLSPQTQHNDSNYRQSTNHNAAQQNQSLYAQNDLKQLQAYQLMIQQQQLQQQMSSAPYNQILQQQLMNRFNHVQLKNWQQQQQQSQQQHQNGNNANIQSSLDHSARYHRSSAALFDASCTWSGVLPPRSHRFITYSPKVFLGGIPWDISEQTLMQILKPFGQIRIEWPGKEQNAAQPKGYVYVIFESEKQVKALLQACSIQDAFPLCNNGDSTGSINSLCSSISGNTNGNYYYKISSKRIKEKEVEVIPWIIGDSNYIKSTSQKLDSTKTVFVGALHGKLTAEALAKIMNDLFDGVVYAGIDTDKYKYPIGSGRVTFNNTRSYMRAVSAAFIEIKTSKFTKKVQIDPYLEDALCSMCGVQHGPYYCRELSCFRYFCRQCWQSRHLNDGHLRNHKPLTRNSKTQQILGVGPAMFPPLSVGSSSSGSSGNGSNPGSPTTPPTDGLNSMAMLNFRLK